MGIGRNEAAREKEYPIGDGEHGLNAVVQPRHLSSKYQLHE